MTSSFIEHFLEAPEHSSPAIRRNLERVLSTAWGRRSNEGGNKTGGAIGLK
jgi:hypothetical protein